MSDYPEMPNPPDDWPTSPWHPYSADDRIDSGDSNE